MAPVTDFAVKEKYKYLEGFGNYHSSEAFPGAVPIANNTPLKPAYGLRTERISGTSFTAPRALNLQTFIYRSVSSLDHDDFIPLEQPTEQPPQHLSPNSYAWPRFPVDNNKPADWVSAHKLLARNGDPATKEGLAIWVWSVRADMPPRTAFSSLDGELLIVPQAGALDVQTELGSLLVRQNEIAVIPRGIRHRVTLPAGGGPARGYTCELFQGHFRLPELGPVGSTGLANARDFQVPVASFSGSLVDDHQQQQQKIAVANDKGEQHTITSRQAGRLWRCTQSHTPFDVAAWHGTLYPYKYDLARFAVMGNLLFDEHDPSLYTVLTAPSHASSPGTAVVDLAIIPPRWMVARDTFRLPYFHRNTCCEFYAPIIHAQDPSYPFNGGDGSFLPFGAGLHGGNVAHGPAEGEFLAARDKEDGDAPEMVGAEGITVMLLETERPLFVSEWGRRLDVRGGGLARRKKDDAELLVQEGAKKEESKSKESKL